MTQYSRTPEYSLEEKSARIYPQWDHSRTSNQILLDQVVANLRWCIEGQSMLTDTSERTLDLLLELRQSLEVQ